MEGADDFLAECTIEAVLRRLLECYNEDVAMSFEIQVVEGGRRHVRVELMSPLVAIMCLIGLW